MAAGLEKLDRESRRFEATRQEAVRVRDESAAELSTLMAATAGVERAAAEEGRRLAGLEERLRGERRREAGLKSQERALAEELALRAERGAALDREREALSADHTRLSSEVSASIAALAIATDEREPLRMEAMGAEIAAGRLTESLQAAHAALVERDRERDHAGFSLERSMQDLDILRDRIGDDLDLANPEEVLGWSVSVMTATPADREAEIARLRERLRRVGYVGDDAVADFEREHAQQAYLREQLADVEGAAAALRDLLVDLRRTMRSRFDETFAMVAAAFAEAFATLFGGGTAQLVLTTGDNGTEPGIDIIAQPPGKRLQSLALLSGGERALTAAALLIAILKVNPVPFCLLDEVDAALDEANVVRFRERLRELAAQSQIIVVTHNRGTIEIADTLYGVSMGADGVSQVLSLRLSESLPADLSTPDSCWLLAFFQLTTGRLAVSPSTPDLRPPTSDSPTPAGEDRRNVRGDVLSLLGAIEEHRFQHLNAFRVNVIQRLHHGTLVTRRPRVSDELPHGIGQRLEIDVKPNKRIHLHVYLS